VTQNPFFQYSSIPTFQWAKSHWIAPKGVLILMDNIDNTEKTTRVMSIEKTTLSDADQHRQKPESTPAEDQPLNPLWLIPITLVAGLPVSAPVAGATLVRCGYRTLGWACGIPLAIVGVLALFFAVIWGVEWYWTALSLVAFHILCGAGLFLALRKPYQDFKKV
jgi:hypothetical protein